MAKTRKKEFKLDSLDEKKLDNYGVKRKDIAKMVQLSERAFINSSAKTKYTKLVVEGIKIAENAMLKTIETK